MKFVYVASPHDVTYLLSSVHCSSSVRDGFAGHARSLGEFQGAAHEELTCVDSSERSISQPSERSGG